MGAQQALYRKYRGRSFNEIIGQDHITEPLANAIKQQKISHAYLFTGPRGVGKTSVARIVAHQVNDLDYKDAAEHIDIIEIDAASNRKIDEIRDLREKIHIAPAQADYKVYIIDEVHMLTREAFNALLKTLEEPPAHAIFILATTEAHKVPATIVSRTQRHTFLPIPTSLLQDQLKSIAKQENIDITDEALELLAEHGDGSFRDSISLLDLMRTVGDNKIDGATVRRVLGLAPGDELGQLLQSVHEQQPSEVLGHYDALLKAGNNAVTLANQLLRKFSAQWRNDAPNPQDVRLSHALLSVLSSPNPEIRLEVVLLNAALPEQPQAQVTDTHAPVGQNKPSQKPKSRPARAAPPATVSSSEQTTQSVPAPQSQPKQQTQPDDEPSVTAPHAHGAFKELSVEDRQSFLAEIKRRNNPLHAVIRVAVLDLDADSNVLRLRFKFPFHHKQTTQQKNRDYLTEAARQILNEQTQVVCEVDTSIDNSSAQTENMVAAKQESDPAANIIQTFGGGEVIEI